MYSDYQALIIFSRHFSFRKYEICCKPVTIQQNLEKINKNKMWGMEWVGEGISNHVAYTIFGTINNEVFERLFCEINSF